MAKLQECEIVASGVHKCTPFLPICPLSYKVVKSGAFNMSELLS